MFTFRSKDKEKLLVLFMRIARDFEPNSNYQMETLFLRDKHEHDYWVLSVRLLFPHMHYKREVVQRPLYSGSFEIIKIPVERLNLKKRQKHRREMKARQVLSRLMAEEQATLEIFYPLK